MQKRVTALSLILVFALMISAQAAGIARTPQTSPTMTFNGTMATFNVLVKADKPSDTVSVRVKLWRDSTCLNSWAASGTGSVSLSKTVSVISGKTYTLTVDATINGEKQSTKSITKTYP